MTKRKLSACEAKVREILPRHADYTVECFEGCTTVQVDELGVTFEMLSQLSEAFGTKLIDLRFDRGWGGTDVTPGDPPEFKIVIRACLEEPKP